MKNPLISVCIPNYNYEKFIGETIESVLAQTYENFELIIVDNGSTDSSAEIIKSYNDPRIKFYQNETNIPVYQNINNAQKLAQGELVAVLHSDDLYEPNFLEEIVKAYEEYPSQKVFVTGVYLYHHEENKVIIQRPFSTGGLKVKLEVLLRLCKENNIGNGVNVVYHRDCLEKSGMFSDEFKYSADYDLWFRLAELYNFVYIPKILTYYRIHDSNLSHTVNKNLSMVRESYEIFYKNLTKSKILTEDLYNNAFFINYNYVLYKFYCLGVKYKSGSYLRELLNYLKTILNGKYFNPVLYYTYLISFLIDKNNPEIVKKPVFFVNRVIFYFYRYFLNKYFSRFIEESLNQKNVEIQPVFKYES